MSTFTCRPNCLWSALEPDNPTKVNQLRWEREVESTHSLPFPVDKVPLTLTRKSRFSKKRTLSKPLGKITFSKKLSTFPQIFWQKFHTPRFSKNVWEDELCILSISLLCQANITVWGFKPCHGWYVFIPVMVLSINIGGDNCTFKVCMFVAPQLLQ